MNLRKVFVPAVAVAALLLGGCSQKTDYATFHQKALDVAAHSFKSATFEVKVTGDNGSSQATYNFTYASGIWQGDKTDAGHITYALVLNTNIAASVGEDENYVYYFVGKGFKVEVGDNGTYTYEEHGLITSHTAKGQDWKISYK